MAPIGRFRYVEGLPSGSRSRVHGTLVLLHAFPLNARMWEPQLALAELGWHIVAPHVRGADGGASTPAVTSIDDYAADLVDLLDTLHIEEAVICGLSMGGYVAFALLRRAPSYVRALVLADTRPQADTPEGVEGRKRMLKLVIQQGKQGEQGEQEGKGVSAIADEMLPKLLGETTIRTRPEIVDKVRALVLANSADSIAGSLRALMSRPDSTPLLAGLRIPTLVIVGAEDSVTPPPMSQAMHQEIAGSELVVIPSAGHLSSIEQPAAFNDALARLLTYRV